MRNSQRSHEGYLLIDHRAGDGLSINDSLNSGCIPVKAGSLYESATITCSHCQTIVVLNPDRQRSRGYCPKCDSYICDTCESIRVANGGDCTPYKKIIEDIQEYNSKKG